MFLITVLHITVCIALIIIVLLQAGKGADIGASLGGAGSQTLFGTTGSATMISKITTGIAILFMLTSLTLAYSSGKSGKGSLMETVKPVSEKTIPATDTDKPVSEKTIPATDTAQATEKKPLTEEKAKENVEAATAPVKETPPADK